MLDFENSSRNKQNSSRRNSICHSMWLPEGGWLPLQVKILKNQKRFTYTHCVFCGKNITWMNVSEEKILQDQAIKEVPEGEIKPEEMEWYQKKMKS